MRIYIGNLSYDVTEAEIKTEFEAFGRVGFSKCDYRPGYRAF